MNEMLLMLTMLDSREDAQKAHERQMNMLRQVRLIASLLVLLVLAIGGWILAMVARNDVAHNVGAVLSLAGITGMLVVVAYVAIELIGFVATTLWNIAKTIYSVVELKLRHRRIARSSQTQKDRDEVRDMLKSHETDSAPSV